MFVTYKRYVYAKEMVKIIFKTYVVSHKIHKSWLFFCKLIVYLYLCKRNWFIHLIKKGIG